MVSVTRAAHNLEVTAESLQADLARLEVQKQALERELAAVVAHLGSVERALSALQAVMTQAGPVTADSPADTGTDADANAGRQRKYGKLTEQILDYFAEVGDADVRARDVATVLGRGTDSGSINAVRSALDRLVGTSRIRRTGRGLYRAGKS